MKIKSGIYAKKIFNDLKINMTDNGYAELSTEWHAENVCSPFCRIYYIFSGEGYVKSKSESLKLTAGSCYFIPAELTYDYWCAESMTQLFFHINAADAGGRSLFTGIGSFAHFAVDEISLKEIFSLYNSDDFRGSLKLKAYLDSALWRFAEIYGLSGFSVDNYSPEISGAVRYISNRLSAGLKISDIASQLLVSESKLVKKFKAETGTTVGKYIDGLIFSRAEILLSQTDRSVKSISDELGFCDQFYFSRRFKQKFNEAPLEYRKRMRICGRI